MYENIYLGTFEHQFLYLVFGKVLSFGYQQTRVLALLSRFLSFVRYAKIIMNWRFDLFLNDE